MCVYVCVVNAFLSGFLLVICVRPCVSPDVCVYAHVSVYTFVSGTTTHRVSGSSPAAQTATWPRYQR